MRYMEYNGETHSLKEWSRITGIRYLTIYNRYIRGYPPEKVLKNGNLLHDHEQLRETKTYNCTFPECFNCKYEDCRNNSPATEIETKIYKAATERLPDSEGAFEHAHRLGRSNSGKVIG